jgi:hypothetical protein
LVFVLDADNIIEQGAISALAIALADDAADTADFAYGIVQCFGGHSQQWSDKRWDLSLLLERNYLDAMAMFRRRAVLNVGGYDAVHDRRFGGWEDYGLYLSLASAGSTGVWLDQVVGRYRVHDGSMSSVANLARLDTFRYLRRRYSRLPWKGTGDAVNADTSES